MGRLGGYNFETGEDRPVAQAQTPEAPQGLFARFADYVKRNRVEAAKGTSPLQFKNPQADRINNYSDLNIAQKIAGAVATPVYAAKDLFNTITEPERKLGTFLAQGKVDEINSQQIDYNNNMVMQWRDRAKNAQTDKLKTVATNEIKRLMDSNKKLADEAGGELAKQTNTQLAGLSLELGIDFGTAGLEGLAAKFIGKQATKEVAVKGAEVLADKGVNKIVKFLGNKYTEAGAVGGTYAVAGKMQEGGNATAGDYVKTAATGVGLGVGLGLAGSLAGRIFRGKGEQIAEKTSERALQDEAGAVVAKTEQPRTTMADIRTNQDAIVPLKPAEINPAGRMMEDIRAREQKATGSTTGQMSPKPEDILATFREEGRAGKVATENVAKTEPDIDKIIKDSGFVDYKVSDKSKIPALEGKSAQGKARYNFETQRGEIVVAKNASAETKAHEFAHPVNYQLGGGKEKFTTQLDKFVSGQSEVAPKAIEDYARKTLGKGTTDMEVKSSAKQLATEMHAEIKTASRIDPKVEFRLNNTSEEFATAVSNILTKKEGAVETAPRLSQFIQSELEARANPIKNAAKKEAQQVAVKVEKKVPVQVIPQEQIAKTADKTTLGTAMAKTEKIDTKQPVSIQVAQDANKPEIIAETKKTVRVKAPSSITEGGLVKKDIKPIKSDSINLEKLNTSDDVKNAIEKIAAADKGAIDTQRRGTINKEELEQLSELTGIKTKDILNAKPGAIVNAENALATRKIMLNAAQDLTDFTATLGPKATKDEMMIFKQKLDKFRGLQKSLAGFRSEAGRLLQQFSVQVAPNEYEMMDDLIKRVAEISQSDASDIQKMVKIGKELKPDNLFQLAVKSGIDVRTAFMLYSPTTQVANIVGNTWQSLSAPLKKWIGEKISTGAKYEKGIVKGEASAHVQGLKDALPEAWGILRGDLNEIFHGKEPNIGLEKMSEVTHQRSVKEFLQRIGVGEGKSDKIDTILKSSFHMLSAADKFFRTINFAGELYSQALRKATQEGLSGKELEKRISGLLENPSGDEEFFKAINKQVDISLFQEKTAVSKSINKLREEAPVTKLIVPFVQTPLNVAIETVRTSPLGFLRPAMAKARGKEFSEAEKAMAYAQATVGTALSAVALGFVASEKITGAPPTSAAERDEFYASGKQPYAIKVGDQWVSYRRIEPLASVLANTVNAYKTIKTEKDWSSAIGKSVAGYSSNFLDQTFLQGVSDMYNAISDPDRYGGNFIQQFATSFVPSIFRSTAAAGDRNLRDVKGMGDAFKNITPGMKGDLPSKVDIFGREVKREGGFVEGILSPFYRSTDASDPTVKALEDSSYNLTTAGLDKMGGVKLDGKAKEEWLKMVGVETKKELDKLTATARFQNMQQSDKDKALENAVRDTRDRMRSKIMVGQLNTVFQNRKKIEKDKLETYDDQFRGKLSDKIMSIAQAKK